MNSSKTINVDFLLTQPRTLLLDAYGVLVDEQGALKGAIDFINKLNQSHKPYFILTNSASDLPTRMAEKFQARGLAIDAQRIISAGLLLSDYVQQHQLQGAKALVLGTQGSQAYAQQAGLELATPEQDAHLIIIADQAGFPLLDHLDAALNLMITHFDRQQALHLILCNPDLLYPHSGGRFGLTSGALAAMLEAVIQQRYGQQQAGFVRLGKPYAPIFQAAAQRAATRELLMVGDQLSTDILGAKNFGIPAVLVKTGLGQQAWQTAQVQPDYVLAGLSPNQ